MEYCCDESCQFENDRSKKHLLHHIKYKIPTNIKFAERLLMPTRRELLTMSNREAIEESSKLIKERKPFLFMPNDVQEPYVYDYGVEVYKPYLIGIMPCGTKATVILNNVPVFFDVKLPDFPPIMSSTPLLESKKNNEFIDIIMAGAHEESIKMTDSKIVQMLPADGFRLTTHPYFRMYFQSLKQRKLAFDLVKRISPDCITASDDTTSYGRVTYFSKVAREFKFSTADWNEIKKYSIVEGKTKCEYTFNVDVCDFKAITAETKKSLSPPNAKLLDFDNALVAQWDIETDGKLPDVRPPSPDTYTAKHFDTSSFVIFMMNTSIYQQWSTTSLVDVCVVDASINTISAKSKAGNEKNTLISIICDTEKQVLIANMDVWGLIQPEILGGFNTAGFDWPVYREKLYNLDLLGDLKRRLSTIIENDNRYKNESVYSDSFAYNKSIKLSAERTHVAICSAKFSGMIDTDGLANFLKLYPRAEIPKVASLNYFLKVNKLESKEDMPYKRMFKIHARSQQIKKAKHECHCHDMKCDCCESVIPDIDCLEYTEYDYDDPRRYSTILLEDIAGKCCYCGKRERNLVDMELVAIYCRIDCQRPQELNVKRSIIGDKRELANLSFTPLYNAFAFADGEKVRNMMGAYCYDYGVAFSNIMLRKAESEKDWNVGGFVVTPKRGLYKVPITGLDFESLYPSLIATYNLSPDMIITDPEFAKHLESIGYTLYPITDESGTHLTFNRGEKKNDPSNEVFNNVSWAVRHNGILSKEDKNIVIGYTEKYSPIYGREALPQERLGYMAHIVKSLKELRQPVKREFVAYSELFEELEKEYDELKKELAACYDPLLKSKIAELKQKLSETSFMISKTNSKSNSIKVLNNTFYGQVSQYRNSFYNINIAGGITSAGRKNLKLVKKFVEARGFFISYGDTDSLYIACPQAVYDSIPYPAKTEEYYTEMVKIAMKVMKQLQDDVFNMLIKDNGTLFLKMAYEEVGLFTFMCGKKKYYMIPHAKTINFHPSDLFIRGLELKKQGQTEMSKELQLKYLWQTMDLAEEREPIDIAIDVVKSFFTAEIDYTKFAKMNTYRPTKKNVSVLTFVERMRELGKPIPDAGDKFKTVVVAQDQQYSVRGTMISKSVGGRMEYLHDAQANGLKLDILYYLESGVFGSFSRFIAYHPQFQLAGLNMEDPIEYKKGDKYSVDSAKKYLKQICREYINAGLDIISPSQRGRQLQREYKLSVKQLTTPYSKNIQTFLANKKVAGIVPTQGDNTHPALFIEKLRKNIKDTHTAEFATLFVKRYEKDIFVLKRRFDKDYRIRRISITRLEDNIHNELMKLLPKSWQVKDDYDKRLNDAVVLSKTGEVSKVRLTDIEQELLDLVSATISRFQAAILCKLDIMRIATLIEEYAANQAKIEQTPKIVPKDLAREESKYASVIDDYVFG